MTTDCRRRRSAVGNDHGLTPDRAQDCVSCGSGLATAWSTPDGTAWLCRECATLHSLGCP